MIAITKDSLPNSLKKVKSRVVTGAGTKQEVSLILSDCELLELHRELGKYIVQQQIHKGKDYCDCEMEEIMNIGDMDSTEKLLKTGFDWLNENAAVGMCNDRSCTRCRLADVLFEINERKEIKMYAGHVEHSSEEGAKELLKQIIEHLDELDDDDHFGTEGWRHSFGIED